jgi:23S rRNA (uracil1939-C5)-methyltransferase
VEKLVPGGEGFCRLPSGEAGFVPGGLPGDVFTVTEGEARAGYVRAHRAVLAHPGPERVAPPCPIAAECGGCDWMALARGSQLEHKRALVIEAFRRTARLGSIAVDPVVTAGDDLGYRRRVRLHVAEGQVGFHRAGAHAVVPVRRCLVAHPALERVFEAFGKATADELAGVEAIEARHASDGSVVARVEFHAGHRVTPGQSAALRALGAACGVTIASDPEQAPSQAYALPGATLHVGAGVFTQVNWEVNQALVSLVVEGARRRGVSTFCDLFAGAGNFTLPLVAAGLEGVAVEHSEAAIAWARRSAERAGLRVRFLAEDAGRAARRWASRGRRFDLVVLDPPRAGARAVLGSLVALGPRHIVYVSCDPVTLARDPRTLVDAGYALESLTPFDMFPHTHHVEVVAWFCRGPA